jgi:hypothetical protein
MEPSGPASRRQLLVDGGHPFYNGSSQMNDRPLEDYSQADSFSYFVDNNLSYTFYAVLPLALQAKYAGRNLADIARLSVSDGDLYVAQDVSSVPHARVANLPC